MALIDAYATPLDAKAAEHLLRRVLFGASRQEIAQLTGKTASQALDILLADGQTPAPPVDPATGQTWVNGARITTNDSQYNAYFRSWWIGRMMAPGLSGLEKLTLFWQNHFVSTYSTVGDSRYIYKQNALLRKYALGNVKTLAREISYDPAMLRYLNGNTNRAGAPQENYARELQELFTIGKGAEIAPFNYTNYTEDDVRAAAKALTGWTDNNAAATSSFQANRHDTTDKKFSAAYDNYVLKGRTGADAGLQELDDLLAMIFKQAETARNLCRKLYRWFVNDEITAEIEANFIEPLAQILRSNNYEVKPMLRAMLGSEHFFDPNLRGCMIKTPLDLVLGTARLLQGALPDAQSATAAYYTVMNYFRAQAASMQQDVHEQPNVAGWAAYYQEPSFYQLWANTATLPLRSSFTNAIVGGISQSVSGKSVKVYDFDAVEYAKQFPTPEDPVKLIDNLCENFFATDLTQKQKDNLLANVLLPGLPSYEWTVEWNAYVKNPTSTTKKAIQGKLNNLLRFMMGLAEFQVC